MKRSITLQSSPTFALWMTNKAVQAELRQALTPRGLSYVEYLMLLVLIVDLEGATWNHKQLKKHSQLDKMTISRALNSLEGKGLITRQKNIIDERNVSIRATNKSKLLMRDAIRVVEAIDRRYLARV